MSRDDRSSRTGGARETHEPGQHIFHYSREERLQGREQTRPGEGGIFKRNRSLLIILLDILLVLLMFLLYVLFLRGDAGTVRFNGYRADGSAFIFDEQLFVTVTVERTQEDPVTAGEESLLRLRFADGTEMSDVLPTDPEFSTVIRHVITGPARASAASDGAVRVVLVVRGDEHELSIPVEPD